MQNHYEVVGRQGSRFCSLLDRFIYRLTDGYKKKLKETLMGQVAEKKAILNVILSDLSKNQLLIEPGSKESAYVIQCIFL